jgi:Ca2+-binding EF-hand superfamily protein
MFAAPAAAQTNVSAQTIERLRQADANHDGLVSRQEFVNYRARQFGRLDRNGDGYITNTDMPSVLARRAPAGMSPQELVVQFDANRDGRVSQSEFVNGPTPAFDAVDANNDNVATEAEFNAAAQNVRAAR